MNKNFQRDLTLALAKEVQDYFCTNLEKVLSETSQDLDRVRVIHRRYPPEGFLMYAEIFQDGKLFASLAMREQETKLQVLVKREPS